MAFDLSGPRTTVGIDRAGEAVFDLPARYGEPATFLTQIRDKFYQSFMIQATSVQQFRAEVLVLREHRAAELAPQLRARRMVYARDKDVEKEILARLLAGDTLHALLHDLVALCDECIEAGVGIRCDGD